MERKLQTAFDLAHPIALGLSKLSICFFYRRLFRGYKFNIVSWATIAIVILWSVSFTIAIAASCRTHFEAYWASLMTLKAECADTFHLLLTYSVTDVIMDVLILVVPIPMVCMRLLKKCSRLLIRIGIRLANAFEAEVRCLWCHSYRSAVSFPSSLGQKPALLI